MTIETVAPNRHEYAPMVGGQQMPLPGIGTIGVEKSLGDILVIARGPMRYSVPTASIA